MTNGEIVTDTGAVAAIISPWWLPSIHTVSTDAALLLPIFGVIWLTIQIALKLWQTFRKSK